MLSILDRKPVPEFENMLDKAVLNPFGDLACFLPVVVPRLKGVTNTTFKKLLTMLSLTHYSREQQGVIQAMLPTRQPWLSAITSQGATRHCRKGRASRFCLILKNALRAGQSCLLAFHVPVI